MRKPSNLRNRAVIAVANPPDGIEYIPDAEQAVDRVLALLRVESPELAYELERALRCVPLVRGM